MSLLPFLALHPQASTHSSPRVVSNKKHDGGQWRQPLYSRSSWSFSLSSAIGEDS